MFIDQQAEEPLRAENCAWLLVQHRRNQHSHHQSFLTTQNV
jgi:hypothetical protein